MFRIAGAGIVAACLAAVPATAQSPLEGYFVGKQVVVKMDMPGTQKGIDLHYDKPAPMDWNDYSSRIKTFGVALHQGDVARVTKFVVKKDMIEFQLDGGGFGTAGDDSSTTVSPRFIPKSDYEKDLEKKISQTTEQKKKNDLQNDLDRERSRREREQNKLNSDAAVASQLKAQQVADKRLHGGSRINLRWKDSIPSDTRSPDAVIALLAQYVDFNVSAGAGMAPPPAPAYGNAPPAYGNQPPAPSTNSGSPQLKRGMKLAEVTASFGQGRPVSDSISNDGLKTMVMDFRVPDGVARVTFVEGVVVRYSIESQ